jgi:hypothetical protein
LIGYDRRYNAGQSFSGGPLLRAEKRLDAPLRVRVSSER